MGDVDVVAGISFVKQRVSSIKNDVAVKQLINYRMINFVVDQMLML
jgi:hypothetical protein